MSYLKQGRVFLSNDLHLLRQRLQVRAQPAAIRILLLQVLCLVVAHNDNPVASSQSEREKIKFHEGNHYY